MIQFKVTNVNALEERAKKRMFGDWTGYLLGTHTEKLRDGGYSTRQGLRLSHFGSQAQVSITHRIYLQGMQLHRRLFLLAEYVNRAPIITSAQGRATTRSSERDATRGTGNDIRRAE